ncbi:hypothetical protein Lesp02_30750 [Lentzea sp. NBRC 105346]|uniref:sigma-70 family RNA polymerase sigma factor n=1 Tax=Lentzea sp. NBRC 105346 TaxID=3032205 RepID=UPI0024A1570E|nr:sigma-70 family RNA polymerase sigma factor [Lentzea sp. NBRC 105346]GLZ30886.1 hypothetical protein Lesp02_30750 [Lentzea sp. NBRC 105346]
MTPHDQVDRQLIKATRSGDVAAYGELYKRHVGAAHNLARQLAHSTAERDDLVSEAFSDVLQILRTGRGPDSAFRAYLLTALRHAAYDRIRKGRKVELHDDITTAVDPALVSVSFPDTVMAEAEQSLVVNAFAQLPDRWRMVLWLTEVEGRTPSDVGPSIGLTANGVSALAYRAREGLRQAYLQAHLAAAHTKQCEPTINVLGAWTRGGLPTQRTREVEEHLDRCDSCHGLSLELGEIDGSFRTSTRRTQVSGQRATRHRPHTRRLSLTMETGHYVINTKLDANPRQPMPISACFQGSC